MSRWRAILRPYRVEVTATVFLFALMVIVAGLAIVRLLLFDVPPACLQPMTSESTACEPYRRTITAYYDAAGSLAPLGTMVTILVPVLSAMVLGLVVIGREIEQQTTNFVWSVAPSRIQWLRQRLVPILLLLVLLGLVAGGLGDVLTGLRDRSVDQSSNFDGLGTRGPAIASAGLLVFGIALLAGAVIGRQLPALLISGALVGGAVWGASNISDAWLQGDAEVAGVDEPLYGAKYLDSVVMTRDGEVISWEEAYSRFGADVDLIGMPESQLTIATRYVPGDRYPAAVARLSGLLAFAGAVALALSFLVVHRRRPT